MPRRAHIDKRKEPVDALYHNEMVGKIVNRLMRNGKKSTAEGILYDALKLIEEREKKDPISVLEQAVKNSVPLLEVKARRVGGATYQVPVEVQHNRGFSLGIRWLLKSSQARAGKSMAEKLAAELVDASRGQGATIKKREDTHKMAEANRAFAHYKW